MKGRITQVGLASLLLAGIALAGQDTFMLRRELKEGAVDKYKVSTKMNTLVELPGGLGEQEMGMTSEAELELKFGRMNWQIPGMSVDATMKITKMDAEGMMAGAIGQDLPGPVTLKGFMDLQGRLRPAETKPNAGLDMSAMQSLSLSSMTIPLPEKPVKVGDSWQVLVPRSVMAKKDQFITATLKGEKDGAWLIGLSGKYQIEMEPRELPKTEGSFNPMAGQKMGLKGEVQMEGEGLVEKQTGRTLGMTSKITTDQTVSMPDMGVEINSKATVNSKVEILKS